MRPNFLAFDDAIRSAGRLAERSSTMFRLWRVTSSDEGHKLHQRVIRQNWEHLRFIQHGLLLSAVVGAHNLLAGSRSSLTIPRLLKQARGVGLDSSSGEAILAVITPVAGKLGILRHRAFAHLTPSANYDEVFAEAQITPDEIGAGCQSALEAINSLSVQRNIPNRTAENAAEGSYQQMLTDLRTKESGWARAPR